MTQSNKEKYLGWLQELSTYKKVMKATEDYREVLEYKINNRDVKTRGKDLLVLALDYRAVITPLRISIELLKEQTKDATVDGKQYVAFVEEYFEESIKKIDGLEKKLQKIVHETYIEKKSDA